MTLAMAVGPLIGVAAQEGYSFRGAFVIAAGLAVAALGGAVTVRVPFQRKAGKRRLEVFDPAAVPVSVAVAFLALAYGAVTTFCPFSLERSTSTRGCSSLCTLAPSPWPGRWPGPFRTGTARPLSSSRRLCWLRRPCPRCRANSPRTSRGARRQRRPTAWASVLPLAGAAGRAVLAAGPPGSGSGVANALFFTAFDLGIAFGSTLLGWVSQRLGYRSVFIAAAGSLAICLLVFMTMVRPLWEWRDKMAVEEA